MMRYFLEKYKPIADPSLLKYFAEIFVYIHQKEFCLKYFWRKYVQVSKQIHDQENFTLRKELPPHTNANTTHATRTHTNPVVPSHNTHIGFT